MTAQISKFSDQPIIQLIDLKKKFDSHWITNGVTLDIARGKMTVIIGRSGEGKSVLLKQIAGLITPTSGQIIIDGVPINANTHKNMYASFGYVFQFAALLDSLTVYENISISLSERGISLKEIEIHVYEILKAVHLAPDILYKYPSEISGGMRKRVGLARTLISRPHVVLYDEPTSGLDPVTACIIHKLMLNMQQTFNLTSVVISHDVEIFRYADYVALLDQGTIKYFGPAKTMWQSNNPYIYQFIRGLIQGPLQQETTEIMSSSIAY